MWFAAPVGDLHLLQPPACRLCWGSGASAATACGAASSPPSQRRATSRKCWRALKQTRPSSEGAGASGFVARHGYVWNGLSSRGSAASAGGGPSGQVQLACFCCPAAQLTIQPSRPLQLPVSASPPFSTLRLIKLLKPWRDEASDEEGSEGEEEGGEGPQGPPVGQQVGTLFAVLLCTQAGWAGLWCFFSCGPALRCPCMQPAGAAHAAQAAAGTLADCKLPASPHITYYLLSAQELFGHNGLVYAAPADRRAGG